MKPILSEKKIVVILFVMVLITFSLAQEDCRKMEKMYSGIVANTASHLMAEQSAQKNKTVSPEITLTTAE